MIHRELADLTVHINVRRSNLQADAHPDWVRSEVLKSMHERMAAFVVNAKLTEHKEEFSTDYRLSLVVCSPDEFYGLVQREAMRMVRFLPLQP